MFLFLTYAATWTSWLAAWAISGGGFKGYPQPALWMLFFYLGIFAPAFVALWLTNRQEGGAGVSRLLSRLVQSRVPLRWYVFALAYFAAIKVAAALIFRVATGEWATLSSTPWYVMLLGVIVSTPVQAGEEIGWRGYALPRLATRFGLARASILVGIIWATWHLPLFLIPGTDSTGQSFLPYLAAVTALSIAIAWLFANTSGSLLLTMLMHAAINNTNIVPAVGENATSPFALSGSLMSWLTVGLLWVCAGYFLIRMRRTRLELTSQAAR